MKKQLILPLALFVTLFSFAQKKQLKTLEKAIKSNNFAEAKATANELESMLGSMDNKMKSKFYFNRAKALYANGNGDVADFETVFSDLSKVEGNYVGELKNTKKELQNDLLVKANGMYSKGKYKPASDLFSMLYKLVPEDQSYLYYAAVSAVQAQDLDAALEHYLALNAIGYTGIKKEYFATNKETGKEEVLDKATRNLYVNSIKSHISPGERMTESKAGEISSQIALIYINKGENENALKFITAARKADPKNSKLIISEANAHLKLGDKEKYGRLIKEAIASDPNNVDLIYNLGVITKEAGNNAEALDYYKRVLKLDPNYTNALKNVASLILEEDSAIVKKMNNLTNSNADNKIYDQLKDERKGVYMKAIPYLESIITLDAKNEDLEFAKTLTNIYSATNQNDKAKALKSKYGM